MTTLSFGYLPIEFNESTSGLHVENKCEGVDLVEGPQRTYWLYKSWAYPPRHLSHDFGTDAVKELPYRNRVFSLPKTHRISSDLPNDEDRIRFVVWVLGFILGIRLTTEEAGFLDATPVKTASLIDGVLHRSQYNRALESISEYYLAHQSGVSETSLLIGAIHSYFISGNPNGFFFEEFAHLYAALDALFRLTELQPTNCAPRKHAKRVAWMCSVYSIATPDWAVPGTRERDNSIISELRNESFHEALFTGQPPGFAVPGRGSAAEVDPYLNHQMRKLVSRLLVAIVFGEKTKYVTTPLDSRMPQSLQL